jgi:diaminohydroxyphosphoribosylaminopyrimidine deaminase/5-amino-6-(5-phosphoribosylamino)uracil reductase
MSRAVTVGERGRRTAAPNPWVGCVIVRDGGVVAEGFHARRGEPHAEAEALAAAGNAARGATAYVTLEPCAHHGRTPPCADALLEAGITRVVVALEDPDPKVRGRGIARLRERGVAVAVGVGATEAGESLAPYLHHRRTGRAFALLKTATSLDGRVTAADGTSRWVTGEAARADVHALRAESQAVVVGSGTALADRPTLTARLEGANPVARQPLRVLLDARGRVPAAGPLFDATLASTLVFTTDLATDESVDAWRSSGAKVEVLPAGTTGGVDLVAALALLGSEGVLQAMFEGGPTVHGALVSAGLADRVVAYVAGVVLGPDGVAALAGAFPAALTDAPRFRLLDARPLGDDVRLEYVSIGSLSADRDTRPAALRSRCPGDPAGDLADGGDL